METGSFDLSVLSEQYYRERLRFGRWVLSGAFILVASLIVGRLVVTGPQSQLLPLILGMGALEGVLGVFAFHYALPGPVYVKVSKGSVMFGYRKGRVRVIVSQKLQTRFKLVERLAPPTASRFRAEHTPGFFAEIGIVKFPLTRPAFEAISTELASSGTVPEERRRSDPHYGDWRILDYRRAG
jgi:hypothetical protein